MNFGKHGRAVLLGGLLVSTSALVFGGLLGGVATADPGTIKVGGYPADRTGNGNDPHIDTACVGLRTYGFPTGPITAVFSTQSPTKGDSSYTVTADNATVIALDLQNWLTGLGAPASQQGFHVKIDVNGKQKTFWIADPSKGCPKPAPPVTPGGVPAKCTANGQYLGDSLTADMATLPPGSGIGVLYTGTEALDSSKVQFKLDATVVGPVYLVPQADGTTQIWYMTDGAITEGTHSVTVTVTLSNGSCATKNWSVVVQSAGGAT